MASEKLAALFLGQSFTQGNVCEVQACELCPFVPDITMDPDTANNQLTLSEGNKKATHGAWQRYPQRPERFDAKPQVMARDALQGIHYWEVDWSESPKESVYVGVAYGSINRKGPSSEFGTNTVSWIFGQYAEPSCSQLTLSAWHNGKVWQVTESGGCTRVGVLLDWHGGTLSFYKISGNQRVALYRFETKFTEPVFPCFWLGQSGNNVALRPVS